MLTSTGTNTVNGGNDNDTIYFAFNSGQNDTLDGGAGSNDKVIFQGKATTNIVSNSTDVSGVTKILFDAGSGGQTVFVQNVETLQFTNGT